MPPQPPDLYNPVQTATPSTQQPGDYINAQASGADFGAQVGGGLEKVGSAGQQVGDQAAAIALQKQGMINESMATNAETQYVSQLSSLVGSYKSKEGLDAVAALPATSAAITALRQQFASQLPNPAAQQSFNMLASRHEAYAFQDANTYEAEQVKAGDLASAHAGTQSAVDQAGSLAVAQDDTRFKHSLQDVDFGLNRMMQNRGYATAMQQDAATGAVTFDTSTQGGRDAQAVYNAQRDALHGQAWENRIHALADDPVNGNVNKAEQIFQSNKDSIPAEAQMRIAAFLQPKVRAFTASQVAGNSMAEADAGYNQTVAASVQSPPPPGGYAAPQIAAAIHGQESGGRANSATSVDGAVGGYQITPATFQMHALPGESINNPADNAVVGQRIIQQYTDQYHGDAARVAVAYFSGPGNVSPPGSATPYITDAKDGNGKSTSSYVSDVANRLGGGALTKADYYKANYATIIANTRAAVTAANPDDPQTADLAVARTEQQMSAVIRQQELAYAADKDIVFQAANGDLAKGTRPLSIDQMTSVSPQVSQAWDRLQSQQPQVARDIALTIIPENAKNNGGDAKTYGVGFSDVFNRIHLPDSDPNRVTNDASLYPLVGKPGGLTMAGLAKAREELNGKNTPDGEAESAMRKQMFDGAKDQISGTNNDLHMRDPKGDEMYLRWMATAYKSINAAKAAGKSPEQIYNPGSPDYVGKSIQAFVRPPAQFLADRVAANLDVPGMSAPPAPAADQPGFFHRMFYDAPTPAPDLSTPDGIKAAYRSGKMSREDALKALTASATAANPASGQPLPAARTE